MFVRRITCDIDELSKMLSNRCITLIVSVSKCMHDLQQNNYTNLKYHFVVINRENKKKNIC